MLRGWLCLIALSAAFASAGASNVSLGPEILLGSRDLGQPTAVRSGPAMATDGDEMFVVYSREWGSVYADRIDRHGAVKNVEAIPLALRHGIDGLYGSLRVLWFRGQYVVFFFASERVHALRVTREGMVVSSTVLPDEAVGPHFDVATDGDEIVLVSETDKIVRLSGDLEVVVMTEIARVHPYSIPRRSVAYGGGRYTIVTADRDQLTVRFLDHGVLSPPVHVVDINNDSHDAGSTRVVWTGSTFVTAWMECSNGPFCLASWMTLTATGTPALAPQAIEYIPWTRSQTTPDLTLTALDEETIFIAWRGVYPAARAQRFRISGLPLEEAVDAGATPIAAVRTSGGSLGVVDATLRAAILDAPAVAPFPNPLPLVPAVQRLATERLLSAAATSKEIAVARRAGRGVDWADAAAIGIMDHEGHMLRDISVTAREAALATDGDEFFAITADGFGELWFYRLSAPEQSVRLVAGSYTHDLSLVWTGAELVALWGQNDEIRMARLDRDGRRTAADTVVFAGPAWLPRLLARRNELLVTWSWNGAKLLRLDPSLRPLGPLETLPFQWSDLSVAADDDEEVFAARYHDGTSFHTGVAFRRPGEPFDFASPALSANRRVVTIPGIAVTRSGYLVTRQSDEDSYTRMALVRRTGSVEESGQLGVDIDTVSLHTIGPDHVLAIYTRSAEEPEYGGVSRVFARHLTIGPAPRRARK